VSESEIPPPPDTQPPELPEEFDTNRALKTIMFQVGSLYAALPTLLATVKEVVVQQAEHERRIIRLESITELQKEHERRIIRLEGIVERRILRLESIAEGLKEEEGEKKDE
jgi:hypothetical protein